LGFYSYRFEPYPVKRLSQADTIEKAFKLSPTQNKSRPPFRAGDKVKCIDNSGVEAEFSKGGIYNVIEVSHSATSGNYHIAVKEASGFYKVERFEKVEDDAPDTPTPSSNNDIKVGDMVECVDNDHYTSELTLGKQYKVVKISPVSTYVINDLQNQFGYYTSRFKKVEVPKTPPSKDVTKPVTTWEVGDIAQCIDNTGAINKLTVGKKYKVEHVWITTIEIKDNNAYSASYRMDRFEKVEDDEPPQQKGVKTRPPKSAVNWSELEGKVRAGDDVVCIHVPVADALTLGKEYQVFAVDNDKQWTRIKIVNDEKYLKFYPAAHFQKSIQI
jgi:hypothetical protein